MDLGIISMRYAKALLRFAEENKEVDAVYEEMQTLTRSFELPAFRQALQNPVVSDAKKLKLLTCAACGEKEPTVSTRKFLALVLKRGRGDLMSFVAHSFGTLYRQAKHLVEARLVVAAPTDDALISRMRETVVKRTDCDIRFNVDVDPSLGGGFILEYDTYRLDASVRSQLAQLKRELAR